MYFKNPEHTSPPQAMAPVFMRGQNTGTTLPCAPAECPSAAGPLLTGGKGLGGQHVPAASLQG